MSKIVCGDALIELAKLPKDSIDLVVTSPPYDNLRAYNGYSWDFEGIAKELVRVLKPGGVIVWVIGDATVKGSETGTSFKQALYFKELGLNLHDTMIYKKKNPIPLTHNRYEQCFEYMFVFSNGKPKTFNPIMENCIFAGKDVNNKRTFYKTGESKTSKSHTNAPIAEQKIKQNIFEYPLSGGKKKFLHPAPFPEQLAHDHIISWSNPGDIVLDPFNGSGTTTKIARQLARDYIGIDISQEYCDIATKRLSNQSTTKE